MGATAKVLYTPEETAKMEIRNFVNAGLKDVQNNDFAVSQGVGVIRYPSQRFCHFQTYPRNSVAF